MRIPQGLAASRIVPETLSVRAGRSGRRYRRRGWSPRRRPHPQRRPAARRRPEPARRRGVSRVDPAQRAGPEADHPAPARTGRDSKRAALEADRLGARRAGTNDRDRVAAVVRDPGGAVAEADEERQRPHGSGRDDPARAEVAPEDGVAAARVARTRHPEVPAADGQPLRRAWQPDLDRCRSGCMDVLDDSSGAGDLRDDGLLEAREPDVAVEPAHEVLGDRRAADDPYLPRLQVEPGDCAVREARDPDPKREGAENASSTLAPQPFARDI